MENEGAVMVTAPMQMDVLVSRLRVEAEHCAREMGGILTEEAPLRLERPEDQMVDYVFWMVRS